MRSGNAFHGFGGPKYQVTALNNTRTGDQRERRTFPDRNRTDLNSHSVAPSRRYPHADSSSPKILKSMPTIKEKASKHCDLCEVLRILRETLSPASPRKGVQRKAYGKINLGLRVLEKRPDGYHNIETVLHRVNLFDEIRFEHCDRIEIVSTDVAAPGDETNLCFRAASLLQEHTGCSRGVRIYLEKQIPVGAGLGGGSSDAAVVLQELPHFWKTQVPRASILGLAIRLGADIPYFLSDTTALAHGRGEILESFSLDIPYAILLCCPGLQVSTSWAYRHVSPRPDTGHDDPRTTLQKGMEDPRILREEIVNDFEPPVFSAYPQVARIKDKLLEEGAVFALMSGSGSAVYGFFHQASSASRAAEDFHARGCRVSVTPPHFRPAKTV